MYKPAEADGMLSRVQQNSVGFCREKDSSSKTTDIQTATETNPTTDQKELPVILKIKFIYIYINI